MGMVGVNDGDDRVTIERLKCRWIRSGALPWGHLARTAPTSTWPPSRCLLGQADEAEATLAWASHVLAGFVVLDDFPAPRTSPVSVSTHLNRFPLEIIFEEAGQLGFCQHALRTTANYTVAGCAFPGLSTVVAEVG